MNNTLLIHIGMPKTGTTALQNFLLINSKRLEKYGWCYPIISDGHTGNLGELELAGIKRCGNGCWLYEGWILNKIKSEWDKGMGMVLKHLNNKNVIISEETIYEHGMEKFITDTKEKYDNIKVVIYLRRQDRAVESRYNQHIKSLGLCTTFEKFIDLNDIPKNYLQYLLKLDSISKIIGRENLIVRVYEKQQLIGNDIITDFMSVLGIPSGQDDWQRSEHANFSIGGNYLEISRWINSIKNVDGILESKNGKWSWSDWYVQNDFRDTCMKLSHSFNPEKGEHGFFSSDKRKEFLQKFTLDNEQIARKYLNREDGVLFYDNRMDYPVFRMSQSSSFEADIIRVFTAMMYVQDQRTRKLIEKKRNEFEERLCILEKKNNEFAGKILMMEVSQKIKNRKLLFFGAGYKCQNLFDIVGNIPGVIIADNDQTKQGMDLNGVRVKYAGDIKNWREYFVIITCQKTNEIEEQLCNLGLQKEKDYILMKEYSL